MPLVFLGKLSGNHHKVITGVVILQNEKINFFYGYTDVEFHALTNRQIEFYVDNYKPYDKAGAYAIQEWIGVVGIKSNQWRLLQCNGFACKQGGTGTSEF